MQNIEVQQEQNYYIKFNYNGYVRKVCVLAYAAEGSGRLKYYKEAGEHAIADGLSFSAPEDGLLVATVANCPARLNPDALQTFESLEYLTVSMGDDDPSAPLQSGVCYASPGSVSELTLTPLMCSVTLSSVDNLSGLTMEHPRVYLTNISTSAEAFRFNGFRIPSESSAPSDTLWFPTDVGETLQRPRLTLYCYPNDPDPPSPSCPGTGIVVECRIAGKKCCFAGDLPPLGRGVSLNLSLEVRNCSDYDWNVFRI